MVSSSSSSSSYEQTYIDHYADKIYAVVQASFCPIHFEEFRSFRAKFPIFSERIITSKYELQSPLANVFTPWPEKINREKWDLLERLVNKKEFHPVKKVCTPWIEYGRECLRSCHDCRVAATSAGVGLNQITPNPIPEDSEDESDIQLLGEDPAPDQTAEEDEVVIIENPPVEVIELSSDEDDAVEDAVIEIAAVEDVDGENPIAVAEIEHTEETEINGPSNNPNDY